MKVKNKTKYKLIIKQNELQKRDIEMKRSENVCSQIETKWQKSEEKIKQDFHIKSAINSILQISMEQISLDEQLKRILDLILSIPWLSIQSKGCIYLVEDKLELLVNE